MPLTPRAKRELAELIGNEATIIPTADSQAKNSSIRFPIATGFGMFSLLLIVMLAIILDPLTPQGAFAISPTPLRFQPLNASPQALLRELSILSSTLALPNNGIQVIDVQTWNISIVDEGDPTNLDVAIVPERREITRYPDNSQTIEVRTGNAFDADGIPLPDASVQNPAGTLLWIEHFTPDRMRFSNIAPTNPNMMGDFLSAGMPENTPAIAAEYFRAITGLLLEQLLDAQQNAALLEFLSRLPDMQVAGIVVDRIGREGVAIQATRTWLENEYTEYLILSPLTGQIIATETVAHDGHQFGLSGRTVIEYYAWERR